MHLTVSRSTFLPRRTNQVSLAALASFISNDPPKKVEPDNQVCLTEDRVYNQKGTKA